VCAVRTNKLLRIKVARRDEIISPRGGVETGERAIFLPAREPQPLLLSLSPVCTLFIATFSAAVATAVGKSK
jgi:hypothetical protein